MTGALTDKEAFARLVQAVEPYLDSLVFVGGWAHRLLALHEFAGPTTFVPLATDDADVLAPERLQVRQQTLAERLKGAGFREQLRGEETPPISEYHLGEEEAGLYVEFLAPLVGAPLRRDGTPKDTTVVGGVTAQTLRHLDVLLAEPWTVRISLGQGFPVSAEGVQLRVPNPASFMAQKLLVLSRRAPDKKAKDVLYVHDTLAMFTARIAAVRDCWRRVEPTLSRGVGAEVRKLVDARFGGVDDLVRGAARIAEASGRPSPPTPERLAATCRFGLQQLFGPP